jgi:hypothetical protein
MDKYKEITNDWNDDASCMLKLLPVWDLENFMRLIFVAQCVQIFLLRLIIPPPSLSFLIPSSSIVDQTHVVPSAYVI